MGDYRAQDFWTTEDREALAMVTLGPVHMPERGELVRRITTSYVPASAHRGAVDLIREAHEHVIWAQRHPQTGALHAAERTLALALDRFGGR